MERDVFSLKMSRSGPHYAFEIVFVSAVAKRFVARAPATTEINLLFCFQFVAFAVYYGHASSEQWAIVQNFNFSHYFVHLLPIKNR